MYIYTYLPTVQSYTNPSQFEFRHYRYSRRPGDLSSTAHRRIVPSIFKLEVLHTISHAHVRALPLVP
eukprot:COSAG02_NODE_693_length_18428_cov_268.516722_7_plen_67_part_00